MNFYDSDIKYNFSGLLLNDGSTAHNVLFAKRHRKVDYELAQLYSNRSQFLRFYVAIWNTSPSQAIGTWRDLQGAQDYSQGFLGEWDKKRCTVHSARYKEDSDCNASGKSLHIICWGVLQICWLIIYGATFPFKNKSKWSTYLWNLFFASVLLII